MSISEELDLVEELQLRRWARMNYVPQRQRGSLHPTIRAEMLQMDAESKVAIPIIQIAHRQNRFGDLTCRPSVSQTTSSPPSRSAVHKFSQSSKQVPEPHIPIGSKKRFGPRFADSTPPAL